MRAAASVILIAGGLIGVGFILKDVLPHSSVIPVQWKSQEYYVPIDIIAFWGCVVLAVVASVVQTLRAILRDVGRLR